MRQLFGSILLAVGILLMTGSGLCTLFVVASGLSDGGSMLQQDPSVALIPLLFGGGPFVVGLALFVLGRRLLKPK